VAGFYWKLLALEGMAPLLDECMRCAEPETAVELVGIDVVEGGAVCRSCRPAGGRVVPMSPEAIGLIRRILGGDLTGALAEPAGPATSQVADLATVTLESHLERRLRSVRLLPQ
jgi:DNA repair protein RecO (recombination protein O)